MPDVFRKLPTIVYFIQSRFMSTQLNDVQFLATYGTLRDDDDSNAPWAKGFVEVFFFCYF